MSGASAQGRSGERLRAIVLRRTDYGEADRILLLLTSGGRRSVIAKGVRRERSKLAGGIELFGLSDVVVRPGRGELGLLTSARLSVFWRHILEDFERMQFAYQVLKMVAQASEQIDEPEWFTVLEQTLEQLNEMSVPRRLVETWFFAQYMGLMGDELPLRRDVAGNPLLADRRYMYDVSEKALRLSEQGDVTADHIKLLRLIQAKPLAAITQIGGTEAVLEECWLLTRQHAGV